MRIAGPFPRANRHPRRCPSSGHGPMGRWPIAPFAACPCMIWRMQAPVMLAFQPPPRMDTIDASTHRLAFPPPPSQQWVCMSVALYLRVSTEEQREHQTIVPQREFAERYGPPRWLYKSGFNEHRNDDDCPITAVRPAAIGGVARLVLLGAARLPPESPPPSPHPPQTQPRFPRRNARADSQSHNSIALPSLRWAVGSARPRRACRGFSPALSDGGWAAAIAP